MGGHSEMERGLAEYVLASSEEGRENYLLEKIMDEMPGGFFIYRADGEEEIVYANQALVRMFGCETVEEFRIHTGNSFRGIVHPEDLEAVEASIWKQVSDSRYDLDYVEYRIIKKDGEVRWVEDYGHFIHSAAGDIFYVFVGDTTDRKMQEEEERAKNRQEQFRRQVVIEGLSIDYEAIFYVDLDKNIMQTYRFSEREEYQLIKGRYACEFSGVDKDYIRSWVHPDDRELIARASNPEYIKERLMRDRSFHMNYRIVREAQVEYLQLRVVNVGNAGSVSQIVMGIRSVDDEIAYEMERRDLMEDALGHAKLANAAKNIFLANMSHDMRTPMNVIMGFAALAEKSMDNKERLKKYLDKIMYSSEQLLTLINDVLEISSIDTAKTRIEENEFDLLPAVQEIQDTMAHKAKDKDIRYEVDASAVIHRNVYGDEAKLKKILLRLVSNAVKYTGFGGYVRLIVTELKRQAEDYAGYQFVVEDNGIGMNERFQKILFEPFERQKNTTMSGVPGTGLGLTIVKSMVEMMGGTIEVQSKEGVGSRFIVTLGLCFRKSDGKTDGEGSLCPETSDRQKRILVVEDNELNLEIETELLIEEGFLVDTAKDGSIAVEKVKNSGRRDYDVILMDIQMPVMDGYQAARAIRGLPDLELAEIPIIALSANAFDEDRQKSLRSGMNTHVAKPVNIIQLKEEILKLCKLKL